MSTSKVPAGLVAGGVVTLPLTGGSTAGLVVAGLLLITAGILMVRSFRRRKG